MSFLECSASRNIKNVLLIVPKLIKIYLYFVEVTVTVHVHLSINSYIMTSFDIPNVTLRDVTPPFAAISATWINIRFGI